MRLFIITDEVGRLTLKARPEGLPSPIPLFRLLSWSFFLLHNSAHLVFLIKNGEEHGPTEKELFILDL